MATRIIDRQMVTVSQAVVGRVEAGAAACAAENSGSAGRATEGVAKSQALESELATLRGRSKDPVHQAGMAEVATTALHNVGNVLNSVNVSVSLVARRLRESRVPKLSSALALLREHRGQLGSFLLLGFSTMDSPPGAKATVSVCTAV